MAFLPDEQNLQNQQGDGGGTPQSQQAPITSSPAPASGGTAGRGTINQASSSSAPQPFTNLQTYLTANAPQIQAQGDAISGKLNDQFGQITGNIDKAGQDFGQQVQQGYTPLNQQVVDKFTADPTQVANDPTQANSFTGMYNDSYKGPGSFEASSGYGDVNNQVNQGKNTAQQVSTPGGLGSYLQGQNPGETQGMATLDSSLLQGSPQVQTQIANSAARFSDLPAYLADQVTQQDSGVANAVQQAATAKNAAQGAFTNVSNDFGTGLQKKLTDATNTATGFNSNLNDITSKLSNTMPTGQDNGIGRLTPEEQAALGVNQSALDKYATANSLLNNYGNPGALQQYLLGNSLPAAAPAQLSSFLSGGTASHLPANLESVASQADFQKALALSKLGGDTYSSPLNPSLANEAGTYTPDGKYQTFDSAKANGLFDQVKAYDTALAGKPSDYGTQGSVRGGQTPVDPATDWQTALSDVQQQKYADPVLQGAILSALNRLANGFDAPPAGYTPQPIQPSLGGGVDGTATTPVTSGGHAAR